MDTYTLLFGITAGVTATYVGSWLRNVYQEFRQRDIDRTVAIMKQAGEVDEKLARTTDRMYKDLSDMRRALLGTSHTEKGDYSTWLKMSSDPYMTKDQLYNPDNMFEPINRLSRPPIRVIPAPTEMPAQQEERLGFVSAALRRILQRIQSAIEKPVAVAQPAPPAQTTAPVEQGPPPPPPVDVLNARENPEPDVPEQADDIIVPHRLLLPQ